MHKTTWRYTLLLLLLFPTTAYAHGQQGLAYPISWFNTLVIGLPLIVARYPKWAGRLTVSLVLAGVATTVVVMNLVDPIYELPRLYYHVAIGAAVPPLLICAVVGEWLRRRTAVRAPRGNQRGL